MTIATEPLARIFPATASALSEVRRFVVARAEASAFPGHVADDLQVAVTEACAEVLVHEKGSTMVVSWWEHDGVVEIWVKDLGVREYLMSEEEGEGGELFDSPFGFPYILEFVDEWEVEPGGFGEPGTVVRLVKETGAP